MLSRDLPALVLGAALLLAPACSKAEEVPLENEASADTGPSQTAPGVNPKDNITKAEVIFQHDNLENGVTVSTIALKYDVAFDPQWGGNVELPITNVRGPVAGQAVGSAPTSPAASAGGASFSETAIGDLRLRARNVRTSGRISIISAVELVVPTAGSDLAGAGKWQVNPVLGAVYAFNQQTFAFAGYKHYFSVAGDDQREKIDRSEVRVLFARLFSNATWTLGDIKYSRSHSGRALETIDVEAEYGSMLSRSLALSGRVGTSFLDSSRQVGFSINLRKIF